MKMIQKALVLLAAVGVLSATHTFADVTINFGESNIGEFDINAGTFSQTHPATWVDDNTKAAFIGFDTRTSSAAFTIDGFGSTTSVTAQVLDIGYAASVSGTLTIDGSNASYIAPANGSIAIGYSGVGHLVVTNGAYCNGKMTVIGYQSGSSGLLEVSGNGSSYFANLSFDVGSSGIGRVIISNGGVAGGANPSIASDGTSSIDLRSGGMLETGYDPALDTMSEFLDHFSGSDNIRIWNGSEFVHYSGLTEGTDYHITATTLRGYTVTVLKEGAAPVVAAPGNQTTSNTSPRSTDLGWTENGSATSWNIEYGTNGFTQGGGTILSVTNNPYALTGLEPSTSYDWYVRAVDSGFSSWVGSNTFSTLSLLDSYEDDFSSDTGANFLSNDASNWTFDSINDERDFSGPYNDEWETHWYMLSRYEHATNANVTITATLYGWDFNMNGRMGLVMGGNSADTNGKGFMVYIDSSDQWRLITPGTIPACTPLGDDLGAGLDLGGGMTGSGFYTITVTFDRETAPTGKVNLTVRVDRPGGNTPVTYSGTVDDEVTANQIGFRTRYYGSVRNFAASYLDVSPVTCPAPTTQTAGSIAGTSAALGWTENGTATSWDIELGTTGFIPTGTPTHSSAATNPYTVTDLETGTTYEWYVRADNGGGDVSVWTGPNEFTTDFVAQYSQCFDGVPADGSLPDSWSSIENSVTIPAGSVDTYSGGLTPPYRISMYNYSDTAAELILISPEFSDMGNQENQIRFMAKGAGTVLVGTISDPADGLTFSNMQTITLATTWTEYTISLASYSGAARHIAFKHGVTGTYQDVGIDNFHYEIISQPAPTAQIESDITPQSAVLGWSQSGSPVSWSVEYGESGFVKGTGTVLTGIGSSSYTLMNITHSTDYSWYVRAHFASGNSAWTGPHTFTTDVPLITATYTQSFDSVTTPALPDYWSKIESNGDTGNYYVKTTTSGEFSSPNCVLMKRYTDLNSKLYLITPGLSGLTNCQIRFMAKNNGYGDSLVVGTLSDPTDSATFTPFSTNSLTSSYVEYTVPFNSYDGSDVYVGFRLDANSYYAGTYVDDFYYELITPTGLTESSLTYQSVSLNWTQGGDVSTWDIKWGSSGFNPATEGTLISGQTSTTYPLSGLAENTTYNWYVRADYGTDGVTAWIGTGSFTTTEQFPAPSGQSTSSVEHNSASLSWTQSIGSPSGWQVKWGADGFDVDTEGTLISSAGSSPYALSGLSENTAYDWYVRADYGSGNYSVWTGSNSFTTPDSCPAPSSQTESNLEYDSVKLGWAENGSATMWDIKWGADGFNVDTGGALISDTTSNPHALSGLSVSTAYDWYVRADNGGGDFSTWVGPSSFATPSQYPAPTGLSASITGAQSASLNWTANGLETAWDIEWGESGFTQGGGTTKSATSTKPYWLTGLNSGTGYDWYVRANNGGANTSAWSSVSSFTTDSSALFRDPYTSDTIGWYVSDDISQWAVDTSVGGSLDFDGPFSFDSYTRWCLAKTTEYEHAADADVTVTAEITFNSISSSDIGEPGFVIAGNSGDTSAGGFMIYINSSGQWKLFTPDDYFFALPVLGSASGYGTVLGSLLETGTHTITVGFDRANATSGQVDIDVTITPPTGSALTHSGSYTDVTTANQIGFRDYFSSSRPHFEVELLEVTSSGGGTPDLSVNNGPNAGGNRLSIYSGTALGSGSDITSVTICGVTASIVEQSANLITVVLGTAPTTAVTIGDVVIQSTSAGATTVTVAYTYNPAGEIGGSSTQTITLGNGSSTSGSSSAAPLNIYYKSLHCQFIYTKAELEAAGITGPATITEFGYNVVGAPSYALPDFLIRMKHTSNSNMSSGFESTGLTSCYSTSSYAPTAGDFDILTLDTSFEWNGTDNLLFDTAFAQVPSYSSSGTTKYDTQASRFRYLRDDSSDTRNNFSGGTTISELPQLQLTVASSGGSGVDPETGSSYGGYQVTINGTNLGNGFDITNVTICGTSVASIDSQSATEVVVTVDSTRTSGLGDVRVFSTSYGETVESNVFLLTYEALKGTAVLFY